MEHYPREPSHYLGQAPPMGEMEGQQILAMSNDAPEQSASDDM